MIMVFMFHSLLPGIDLVVTCMKVVTGGWWGHVIMHAILWMFRSVKG